MNESNVGSLLDHATMAARAEEGSLPPWAARHFETFVAALTGERNGTPFPCHFGTYAVENAALLYTTVPSLTAPDALFDLRDATLEVGGD